jgi:Na+/proline symporter
LLFLPMIAAPLIVPGLSNGEDSYIALSEELLPAGLLGLMLAGFFSHTMAMVASDSNVITAVITRDLIPVLVPRVRQFTESAQLTMARVTTVLFVTLSMLIAITQERDGFVLDTVVDLVAATMGPISIPLMLGLLPWFRRHGPTAALTSWASGLIVWYYVFYIVEDATQAQTVGLPLLTSLILYLAVGYIRPEGKDDRDVLIDSLNTDPSPSGQAAAARKAEPEEPVSAT